MNTQLTNEKKIIQIISMLESEKLSKKDMLEKAQIKSSTFHKYLNLYKEIGFDLNIKSGNYGLKRYQEALTLVGFEISLLSHLLTTSYIMLPKRKTKELQNAIDKMLFLTSEKSHKEAQEKFNFYKETNLSIFYQKKVSVLDNFINQKENAKITTKNKEEKIITPIDIIWDSEKPYLDYNEIETNETNSIALDDIVKITKLNQTTFIKENKETIFELYGRLRKSYLLKDEERIVDYTRDKLVIANSSNDKEKLFRRLLRYDILCKVTFPKTDVKKFTKLISKSLNNLDSL